MKDIAYLGSAGDNSGRVLDFGEYRTYQNAVALIKSGRSSADQADLNDGVRLMMGLASNDEYLPAQYWLLTVSKSMMLLLADFIIDGWETEIGRPSGSASRMQVSDKLRLAVDSLYTHTQLVEHQVSSETKRFFITSCMAAGIGKSGGFFIEPPTQPKSLYPFMINFIYRARVALRFDDRKVKLSNKEVAENPASICTALFDLFPYAAKLTELHKEYPGLEMPSKPMCALT